MTTDTISRARMTPRARFLAAANRQTVDATPVWFMRQAGRCLPEYRALRQQHPFMTMATTPELATRATLMPVDRFGVDAAVLFADIMLPLAGIGVDFEIRPGVGPVIAEPPRSRDQIARLADYDPAANAPVFDAVRLVRGELGDRAATLGFAGAPFTLACYLIEGRSSREYPRAKALMLGEPETWAALMERLTAMTIDYLLGQIEAGADAVQLFDSWLGLVDRASYEQSVLPYTRRIFAAVGNKVPTIHFSTGATHLLDLIGQSGCSIVSLDWRLPLAEGWQRAGESLGAQGNLDPAVLLAGWPVIERQARAILASASGRPGHIFNLGHGILPETDPDQLTRLVALVHSETAR